MIVGKVIATSSCVSEPELGFTQDSDLSAAFHRKDSTELQLEEGKNTKQSLPIETQICWKGRQCNYYTYGGMNRYR